MSIRIPTSGIFWTVIGFVVLFVGAMALGASISRSRAFPALETAEDSIAVLVPALAVSEQRATTLGAALAVHDAALLADTVGHGQTVLDAEVEVATARAEAATITEELDARIAADTISLRLSRAREAAHVVEVVAITGHLDVALGQNRKLWIWRDTACRASTERRGPWHLWPTTCGR